MTRPEVRTRSRVALTNPHVAVTKTHDFDAAAVFDINLEFFTFTRSPDRLVQRHFFASVRSHYFFFFGRLAVFALALNAAAVGAPLLPTLRIRSGVFPAAFWRAIRFLFA